MTERTWTIGELAAEFDTTLRSIRFYEDLGLLQPERQGRSRVFHARDRVRLQLILRGKRLGFSLDEVAAILEMYDDVPGEAGQLRYLLADIDRRREVLHGKREDLDQALAELDELEQVCRRDLAGLEGGAAVSPASPGRPAAP